MPACHLSLLAEREEDLVRFFDHDSEHSFSLLLPLTKALLPTCTGVRPHTKRSKIGDLVPVHVGTWYAFAAT